MVVNAQDGPYVRSSKSLHTAWLPRVDGVFLTANPISLVQQGVVADVPFISGKSLVDALSLSLFLDETLGSQGIAMTKELSSRLRTRT